MKGKVSVLKYRFEKLNLIRNFFLENMVILLSMVGALEENFSLYRKSFKEFKAEDLLNKDVKVFFSEKNYIKGVLKGLSKKLIKLIDSNDNTLYINFNRVKYIKIIKNSNYKEV